MRLTDVGCPMRGRVTDTKTRPGLTGARLHLDHESPKVEADRQKTVREKVDGDGAEGGYAAGFEINGCPVVPDNQNHNGATTCQIVLSGCPLGNPICRGTSP